MSFVRTNPLNLVGIAPDGKPIFSFPYFDAATQTPVTQSYRDNLSLASRWQTQIGIRYLFN